MSVPGKWDSKLWRRESSASAGAEVAFAAVPASGLDDLQTRLNRWSHLWGHEGEGGAGSEAQRVVSERLSRWMERCFGQHMQSRVRGKGSLISLASSTPVLTAFLGRRATRELSRRILQDI